MATQSQQIHSLEEYLDLEEQAKYRSEYHAGIILALSGGTATHSRLSARMVVVLDRYLSSCAGYDSSLKLYVQHSDRVSTRMRWLSARICSLFKVGKT